MPQHDNLLGMLSEGFPIAGKHHAPECGKVGLVDMPGPRANGLRCGPKPFQTGPRDKPPTWPDPAIRLCSAAAAEVPGSLDARPAKRRPLSSFAGSFLHGRHPFTILTVPSFRV
jgi:hypothetical protein